MAACGCGPTHVCGPPPGSTVAQTLPELAAARSLHAAAGAGDLARVARLLAGGARPESGSGANEGHRRARERDAGGFTPLHYAARAGHVAVAEALLRAGAEADAATTAGGATPLHRAAYMGHTAMVQLLLLRGGAAPHARDAAGLTPLHKVGSASSVTRSRVGIANATGGRR